MHIFFSWQSDIPSSSNLIRDCLEEAIVRLQMKNQIDDAVRDDDSGEERGLFGGDSRIEIDSDTQGVLGSPDIAATIFDKIRKCDLFVGDLTFTGKRQENGRRYPNPNVLIELGYAMSTSPNSEKIILLMDSTFGKRSHLPFDLRNRRFPIEVKDDPSSKEAVVQKLMEIFQLYLDRKSKIDSLPENSSGEQFLQQLYDTSRKRWAIEKPPLLWIGISPYTIPATRQDLDNDAVENAILNTDGRNSGWNLELLENRFQVEGDCVGRGKDIGGQLRLFDIGTMQLTVDLSNDCLWKSDDKLTLHPIPISELPVAFLRLYVVLVEIFKLSGPFKLGISYLNAKNVVLRPGHYHSIAFQSEAKTFEDQDVSLRFWPVNKAFSPEALAFGLANYIY